MLTVLLLPDAVSFILCVRGPKSTTVVDGFGGDLGNGKIMTNFHLTMRHDVHERVLLLP